MEESTSKLLMGIYRSILVINNDDCRPIIIIVIRVKGTFAIATAAFQVSSHFEFCRNAEQNAAMYLERS